MSIFASKAEVGVRYLTGKGYPVQVVSVGPKVTRVTSLLFNRDVQIYGDQLLYPYKPKNINKEAMQMAKAHKQNGDQARKERIGHTEIEKSEGGKFVLVKTIKGKEHKVTINGGFTYEGKKYDTLRDIVREIAGKDYKYEGFGFFGLRSPAQKMALDAARRVLKAKKQEKKKTEIKAEAK